MGITVLKNNAPWGPFTREQVEEGLRRGDFTLLYLAHIPGLKEWHPLGEVLHLLDRQTSPPTHHVQLPPVPGSQKTPPALPTATLPVPPAAKPVQSPFLPVPPAPEPDLPKASFFLRFIAFVLDCVILFIPVALVFVLGAVTVWIGGWWEKSDSESMRQSWALLHRNFHHLLLLVAIGLGWLYAAGLESSPRQATIGKQWMGLKVTDAQGKRIGFLQASGRHAAKYLSALPFFLGFIMALFSARGRALHDRLANTRVIQA
ncbi:MAG: RDD family protein [Methylacidiphilales bacterium]|nr:RDD family protein [Candidatus Methylacidiphilales bacterium]